MSQPRPLADANAERDLARIALREQSARAEAARAARALPARFLVRGAPDLGGFQHPVGGWPTFGLEPAGTDAAAAEALREGYLSARGQLAARRVRRRLAGEGEATARDATPAEVQAALEELQARPIAPVQYGGAVVLPRIAHVRQDLTLKLAHLAKGGPAPRLCDADEDVFELCATLFDALAREHAEFDTVPSQLARLQIPILRIALSGPQFLLDRNHPARRFLASVIEHASGWLGDDAADQAMAAQVAALVERAAREFKGDASLFDGLCIELAATHASVRRKAQLSERRHIDAVVGRDRLDDARNKAKAAMEKRLARGAPSPLVRALLEQDWTRVLALALSREGPGGPMAASCLAAADRMIDAFATVDRAKGGRIELTEEQFLRQTLSIGLAKVGYQGGDLQLVLERLFSDDPRAHQDATLPLRQRAAQPDAAEPAVVPEPVSAREQSLLGMVRALPPGSWLEFVPPSGGTSVRRKLAWVSTSGAPCPMLSWRGAKVDEMTVAALARAIASGHARVLPREDESQLDQFVRRLPLLLRERQKATD